MKRALLVCSAGTLLLFALTPRGAEACARCSRTEPVCEAANWRTCQVTQVSPTSALCTESYAECAWVYNALEVSADGSLARAEGTAGSTVRDASGDVRGCHGLVVGRSATAERSARVRSESSRIVI
jgi:hypothetical protein